MSVRKKTSTEAERYDTIDLSSRLTRVREAIKNLPDDEKEIEMPNEDVKNEAADEAEDATLATTTKKKTPAKKKAAPAAKKKPAAAVAEKAEKADDGMISLSEICGDVGVEPAKARRILRTAEGAPEVEGQRWKFKRAGRDHQKVVKILKDATAEAE